jgi:hypothetical protein
LTFDERLLGQEGGDIKDMLSKCDTMASIPSIIKNKQSTRSIPERGMQFSEKCVLVILGLDFLQVVLRFVLRASCLLSCAVSLELCPQPLGSSVRIPALQVQSPEFNPSFTREREIEIDS